MKHIYHYRATPIANAPSELAKAINKFSSKYRCHVIGYQPTGSFPERCAILHAHNILPTKKIDAHKTLIQYHSEPWQVDLKSPVDSRLVIAQYHATLEEYSSCKIVRNVIDFTTPDYSLNRVHKTIRIGFSPSRKKKMGKWHNKGYSETIAVLSNIKRKYQGQVEIDIISGVSLDECIRRKSKCNILIDECVTASYHRSGLEGLALGKMTVCSISPQVEKVLLDSTGAPASPFVNIWMNDLELELCKIIDAGIDFIISSGEKNKEWMHQYWHPKSIVEEFIKIYDEL